MSKTIKKEYSTYEVTRVTLDNYKLVSTTDILAESEAQASQILADKLLNPDSNQYLSFNNASKVLLNRKDEFTITLKK